MVEVKFTDKEKEFIQLAVGFFTNRFDKEFKFITVDNVDGKYTRKDIIKAVGLITLLTEYGAKLIEKGDENV